MSAWTVDELRRIIQRLGSSNRPPAREAAGNSVQR
jgi:hypothetical protein